MTSHPGLGLVLRVVKSGCLDRRHQAFPCFPPSRTGLGTKALLSACDSMWVSPGHVPCSFLWFSWEKKKKKSLEICSQITEIKFLNKSHNKRNHHHHSHLLSACQVRAKALQTSFQLIQQPWGRCFQHSPSPPTHIIVIEETEAQRGKVNQQGQTWLISGKARNLNRNQTHPTPKSML